MKKKVITAVLCGLLITGLAGCGEQAKPPEKISPNSMASADASSASSSETDDDIPAESTASQEPETSAASTPERQPQAEETESRAAPPAESQPKKETTPAQTEQAKPEPTAPEIQPEQEPQKTPAEAPATPMPAEPEIPAEPETPPQEVQPKTAYDFEFDIEAIKADCIGIGQSMGLTLDASLTPDTASWWNPVTASQSNQGETLKQNLAGYIRFHTADNLSTYGMDEITPFNIYCEARGNGVYSIYFLFA